MLLISRLFWENIELIIVFHFQNLSISNWSEYQLWNLCRRKLAIWPLLVDPLISILFFSMTFWHNWGSISLIIRIIPYFISGIDCWLFLYTWLLIVERCQISPFKCWWNQMSLRSMLFKSGYNNWIIIRRYR